MNRLLLASATLLAASLALPAAAQDAVKADPKHYKVVFENDKVRVLQIKYGPKEKSVMHEHPDAVAIPLLDAKVRFNLPDGKAQDSEMKAGNAMWTPAGKHLPENLGDKPLEVILVELKGKPAAKK